MPIDYAGGYVHGNILGFLLVVIIVGGVLLPLLQSGGGGVPRVRSRPLMTDREVSFWRLLRQAADPLHIAPQVAMGALLRADVLAGQAKARSIRNRFDRKIVDFVLVDDAGRVVLLVELDDRLHDTARDVARDRMTARAGYVTLRINGVTARDPALLRAAIDAALGQKSVWIPPVFNPATSPRLPRDRSARPSNPRA